MFINPKKPNLTPKHSLSLCFVTRYILVFILSYINILTHISAPIHIARHSFACLALANGVSMEIIARMLGHSDIRTTKIYAKVIDKSIAEQIGGLAAKFGSQK